MNYREEESKLIPLFVTPATITNIDRSFTKSETDCFTNIPMYKVYKDAQGEVSSEEVSLEDGTTLMMTNHRSKDPYLFETYKDKLKDIKKFIEHHLKLYLEEIEGADINLATLRITQSWLNKTKPQEYHHLHHHTNSFLSGVFYFNCLPNDSIIFANRSHESHQNMQFPKKKLTIWKSANITQPITKGDLIIFPSWVPHHVDVNETKDVDRISLSFNTFPIGEMGDDDGTKLIL